MVTITPFLWLDGDLADAVAFYTGTFPDARVELLSPQMATFEIAGQRFHALKGGPLYKFNEAVSFFIACESQDEVDHYWTRLTADGGLEGRCGWLKDRFGLSWQVVPSALGRLMSDPEQDRAGRVRTALMGMRKIDIAALELAHRG